MQCVVIDDEPLAIDVITTYLEKVGGMEVVAKCTNPLDAITILNRHRVDLVFLDIEMPNLSGIELVKTLDNLPQFIFTTAYPQYALEGFDLNATDYLVKPIPFPRFLKAIARAKEKHESTYRRNKPETVSTNLSKETETLPDFIFIKSEYENIKINTADIIYLQGLKDYIKIYTSQSEKAILTLSSFKDIQEKLPKNSFLRVHRSFVVNVNYIKAVQKTKIVINDVRIPIGETFKEIVFSQLKIG